MTKRGILSWLMVGLLTVGLLGITTATATEDGQGMTSVLVTLDGNADNNREVTLRQQGEVRYTLPSAGVGRYEKDGVVDGTYDIYLDGTNVNRFVTVSGGVGNGTVTLVTVTFYSDAKTVFSKSVVPLGDCAKSPMKDPERKGSTFKGWVTATWEPYDFSTPVKGTMNLYANWSVDDQKVDISLDGIQVVGSTDIKDGGACSVKLVPEAGVMLPTAISATMDGKPFTDFTYNPNTGELKIPAGAVTGKLSFEGTSVEVKKFRVTSSVENCVLYGSIADTQNGYSGKLVPNTGYALPAAIQVTVNGAPIPFSYRGGEIGIAAGSVTGDIHISGASALGIQAGQCTVIASIGNGHGEIISNSTLSMLEVAIVPDDGFNYPTNVLVMVGSNIFTDYLYDPNTGILTIGSGKVGQVVIAATCDAVLRVNQNANNQDNAIRVITEP